MNGCPLLVICGATASGKTALAIELAHAFDGEIVNADSRQIYRGMDVGTAKPTAVERAAAPHHLLDIAAPDEDFSLGLYVKLAHDAITEVQARGKLPLLVGGTGLYVRAVSTGFDVPEVPPDRDLRRQLEIVAAESGSEALVERLKVLDPVSAARIDPQNVRRVIRAIEVSMALGEPFSARQHHASPYDALTIILDAEKPLLFERADKRLESMVRDGFVSEVSRLLEAGYRAELPSMSALGYRELGRYVRGEWTLEQALDATRIGTRSFIKRQITWFKTDAVACRLDIARGTAIEDARRLVDEWRASSIDGLS